MIKGTTLGLLATATMVAAVSAPALATSEPEPEMPIAVDIIEGLRWSLVRQQVDGALVDVPQGVTITILMEDGTVTGNGGCNDYFGSYQREGDALAFSDLGATEMYCLETSELEAAYLANLAAVTNGFSTGGTLIMTEADGDPLLEFVPSDLDPIPTDGIEGLAWQLEALALPGTGELAPVPAEVVATILLENGRASGHGGCNAFSTSYELAGIALAFDRAVSTKMACPGPVMQYEDALLTQLAGVASWSSDGGSVTLYDGDGQELARLVPAFED